MNDHIAAEDLAAYVDGAMAGEEKTALESHLSCCRECLEALAEIVEIREGRAKVPAEFLRRALGDNGAPVRKILILRPAFGVAAVFLVMVVAGYFFLGRSRVETARIADKEMPPQAVAADDHRLPAKAGPPSDEAPERAVPTRQPQAKAVNGLKMEKKLSTRVTEPGLPAAPELRQTVEPAAAPVEEERLQWADETDLKQLREGGIVGGVEAPLDKDKTNEMKLAAAPVARAEELSKNDETGLRKAVASGRAKGAVMEERTPPRYRFSGSGAAASGAVQLLLAATGRAAAPLAIQLEAPPPRSTMRVEGDVDRTDLLDPGQLDGWGWFPEGLSLELDIAADGAVTEVTTLGRWASQTAARAREAAGTLRFSASGEKSRRAVLSALKSSPN